MDIAANPARGEVSLVIDGVPRVLCLTLGAFARIEAALGDSADTALEARLKTLRPSELIAVLAALATDRDLTAEVLARARINPVEAARAVAEAFRLALS